MMNNPLLDLMLDINKKSSDALDRAEQDIKESLKILNTIGAKNEREDKSPRRVANHTRPGTKKLRAGVK